MNPIVRRLLCVLLVLIAPLVTAAPTHTINYQGYLTDSGGVPVNSAVKMTFRLYNAASGGALIYEESHPSVAVSNGSFSVAIGLLSPISLPFDALYWLTVSVEPDAEMSPRQRLSTSPYAFRASALDSAATIDGGQVTGAVASAGSANFAILAGGLQGTLPASQVSGVLTGASLPATQLTGTLASSQLAAGAVDSTKLGANAVTAGKIAAGAVDAGTFAGSVYAGTGSDFGSAATVARSDHHHAGTCPPGFTSYAGGNGAVLCLQAVAAASSSYTADASACFRTHGGHLCTNVELNVACTAGTPFLPPAINYWLGDIVAQGTPSTALATNSPTDCSNTKVLATNSTTGAGYLCCISQQRY